MAVSNRTRPEFTVDKNGKITTVHRLAEAKAKGAKSRLDGIGLRTVREGTDGSKREIIRFSTAETAKLLRESLNDQFKKDYPNVKFSVRSNNYSMGSSINVSYTDGPPDYEVSEIAELYSSATFNGMTDMKEYKSNTKSEGGVEMSYGADYVFVKREMSDEAKSSALRELEGYVGHSIANDGRFIETPHQVRDMYFGYRGPRFETTVSELLDTIGTYRAAVNK